MKRTMGLITRHDSDRLDSDRIDPDRLDSDRLDSDRLDSDNCASPQLLGDGADLGPHLELQRRALDLLLVQLRLRKAYK